MRDLAALADRQFDVLVVGGGITGVCVARDAARRGLSVALIDRGDFGGETSHNSLKLVHGGVRYLQHFDWLRLRESVRERRFWLAAAPNLVRPLEFVMPAYGHGTKGIEAMWAGMTLYNALSADRNHGIHGAQRLPPARAVSAAECRSLIPGVDSNDLTGGATWFDGQMVYADRVLLACLREACTRGAVAANHVTARQLLWQGERVTGVAAMDRQTGADFPIHGKVTINACGPWVGVLLARGPRPLSGPQQGLAKCMNVVTPPLFEGDKAVAVQSVRGADAVLGRSRRMYFITPWRGRSVVGTSHLPYGGEPDVCEFTENDIDAFVREVDAALGGGRLSIGDVEYCYGGLTPAEEGLDGGEVRRARRSRIIDHARRDGVAGVMSVAGVKYTTARSLAAKAMNIASATLGAAGSAGQREGVQRLPGTIDQSMRAGLVREVSGLVGATSPADREAIEDFVGACGSDAPAVARLRPRAGETVPEHLLRCRCVQAVRHEMAVRLDDAVLRRLDLVAGDRAADAGLEWCADFMAAEYGWDKALRADELSRVRAKLRFAAVSSGAG